MSIGIPCFNNQDSLPSLIESCFSFLSDTAEEDFEVLAVDDGSSDRTWEVLKELQTRYPKLRLLQHEKNQGFGPTISKLFMNTEMEVNALLSADGQSTPESLTPLLNHLGEADLVLGYRRHRQDPLRRKLSSWVYNLLISLVVRRRVLDVNTVVVYRSEHMKGVTLRAKTAFIHAEFFIQMMRNGCSFKVVDIAHHARSHGKASGGKASVILGTIRELGLFVTGKLDR